MSSIGPRRLEGKAATKASGAGTAAQAARPPRERPPAPHPGSRWTVFTNHGHVLILLAHDPALVLREVATRVGITERAVQRIIADLEEAGFLQRERVGRQNRYRIRTSQALRHPIEAHRTVGDLVGLIHRR
jgi:DNA-binding transcriptional ArsR family regulator